jgi:hypothetical protein
MRCSHRLPLQAFFVALALLAGGCTREETASFSYTYVDPAGGVKIESAGVSIAIEGSLRYLSTALTSTQGSSSSQTLEGHPFGLRGGVFFIGPAEYGKASRGSKVTVSPQGVTIDGEARGALPASRAE